MGVDFFWFNALFMVFDVSLLWFLGFVFGNGIFFSRGGRCVFPQTVHCWGPRLYLKHVRPFSTSNIVSNCLGSALV